MKTMQAMRAFLSTNTALIMRSSWANKIPVFRALAFFAKDQRAKRILFSCFCLIFSIPTTQAIPKIQHWKMEQGTPVFFVAAHELPIVDIRLIFDAGSARDDQHPGIAALTANLLNEGAKGLDADQISDGFESMGAIYSNAINRDSVSINLRSLVNKDRLIPVLENFRRVITHPDFPNSAISRKRRKILLDIQKKQESPAQLAQDAFYAALYRDHPYATAIIGTEKSIRQLTRQHILNFYKRYYVIKNATIIIVGDLTVDQAKAVAEELTIELPSGRRATAIPKVPDLTSGQTITLPYLATQTHLLMGQLGMKRGEPDYFPLYVGNHILGGGGMTSRLFEAIREKRGLSYTAHSYFLPLREKGPFLTGLQTKKEQLDQALSVLTDNVHRFINHGPSEAELSASKKNITGGFSLHLNSNYKILNYVTLIGFYGLPLDYLETFNRKVSAVTLEQIKDAFKRRLHPDKMLTVIVGPQDEKANQGSGR